MKNKGKKERMREVVILRICKIIFKQKLFQQTEKDI